MAVLPAPGGEVQSLFEKIGLSPDAAPGKYFMDDYVSHVEGMEKVLPMYGDIRELSEVAQAISGLSPEDRDLLAAVQESPHRLTSLPQFKEFPGNSEYFILEGHIHSESELGWRYITDHMDTACGTPLTRSPLAGTPWRMNRAVLLPAATCPSPATNGSMNIPRNAPSGQRGKSPPSGSGWNRERKNVPTGRRRPRPGAGPGRSFKEVLTYAAIRV